MVAVDRKILWGNELMQMRALSTVGQEERHTGEH
jgi:hypothetical protein